MVMILAALFLNAIGLTFTGLTGVVAYHLRINLKNAANLKKRAISDLRFVALIGFIITFISIPAYHTATFLLTDALTYIRAHALVNFVTIAQTAICIIDAVLKLICLFYAIKTIVYAPRMIKAATPENPVFKKEPVAKTALKTASEGLEVSNGALPTYADNRCPHCNAQLINDADFCHRCGNKLG